MHAIDNRGWCMWRIWHVIWDLNYWWGFRFRFYCKHLYVIFNVITRLGLLLPAKTSLWSDFFSRSYMMFVIDAAAMSFWGVSIQPIKERKLISVFTFSCFADQSKFLFVWVPFKCMMGLVRNICVCTWRWLLSVFSCIQVSNLPLEFVKPTMTACGTSRRVTAAN